MLQEHGDKTLQKRPHSALRRRNSPEEQQRTRIANSVSRYEGVLNMKYDTMLATARLADNVYLILELKSSTRAHDNKGCDGLRRRGGQGARHTNVWCRAMIP